MRLRFNQEHAKMKKLAGLFAALLFSIPALAEHGGPPAPGQPFIRDVPK